MCVGVLRFPFFALLLAVAAALACAGEARADPGAIGLPVATCVLRLDGPAEPRALLAQTDRFDCSAPQTALGPGDFAVLSRALPPGLGLDGPVQVRSHSVWQARSTLYALYADGRVVSRTMDGRAASRGLQLGAVFAFDLPARGTAVARLLWVVEGAANIRGVVLHPTVATPAQATGWNLALTALYAAFGGLCLALLVYNFALWGALRHRFQLAYCAMVASMLLYALSSSGALAWAAPDMLNNDRIRVNYLALALCAVAGLAFARAFFEERVFAGRLGSVTTAASGVTLGYALAFATLAPWRAALLDRMNALCFLLLVSLAFAMLWRAWACRSRYLLLFAVAWAAPIGFALLRILSNFGVLPLRFWIDNSTPLAMALEAVLSSLAIAHRISLLSRERDAAREGERDARALADTDPLTGLLNRRAFLHAAIGRDQPQQLLLIDVDHFKRVNDTVGHDAGDEVLRAVARAIRGAAPAGALVARLGGEEFAIVAPAADPHAVLDRLRTHGMPFDLAVTASIGCAAGPLAREADWKTLYRRADQALLDAKQQGRDRVRRAPAGAHLMAA